MSTAAQPAQKAVLVVARPAAEDYAVYRDARQREHIDHADVEAGGDDQLDRLIQAEELTRQQAAERNHRKDGQRGGHDHHRRDEIYSRRLTCAGVYSSLKMNFKPSANG